MSVSPCHNSGLLALPQFAQAIKFYTVTTGSGLWPSYQMLFCSNEYSVDYLKIRDLPALLSAYSKVWSIPF